ncbi:MAG: aspartate 1-decarboxylase [Thermaerobacter sp.]|nr:aspartate 1-decarboxylase [Thermaerobacter sp.]
MLYSVLRSKIHRVRVTEAQLYYQGSLSLDPDLMEAADLKEHDWVQITSMANGVRWQTYVISAERGSGTVRANGSAARHFAPGDEVIVLAFGYASEDERATFQPRVVFVDENNRVQPATGETTH